MVEVRLAERAAEVLGLAGGGHHHAAALRLFAYCQEGLLARDEVRYLIPEIWMWLNPPAGERGPLNDAAWVALFRDVGFFSTGPPYERGTGPATLFRAATPERARGMSWCSTKTMATRFLPAHDLWGPYKLWTVTVPDAAILAVLYRPGDAGDVNAREIVVDATMLRTPAEVNP